VRLAARRRAEPDDRAGVVDRRGPDLVAAQGTDVLEPSFVWSAQTGFVVLTLGGTESLVTGVPAPRN
jgi:hypothetical protein